MRCPLIILLSLMLPYTGFTQKKIVFEPTAVHFAINNAGLEVNGSVGGLQGLIVLDSLNLGPVTIEGTIDPNTIKTGINLRDNHLKKPDYFNAKEFPKILMVSTQIKKKSNRKYVGNFDLTIKDIKRNILIPFTFSSIDNGYKLQGEFEINRLDYGLGEPSVILSETVKVILELTAK